MSDLLEELKKGKILICDGAMGTMLQARGLKAGEPIEEWTLSHPKDLTEVHQLYLKAGADIILTNTFSSNRLKLKSCGRENKVAEYNIAAVKNARSAVQLLGKTPGVFILGDIGPTGQILESQGGNLQPEEAKEVFKEQIKVFQEQSIDGIIFETFEDPGELKEGIKAAKELKVDFPVVASMTFHLGAKGFRTIMGVDTEKAVKELEEAGADIIGTNCGNGPEEMVQIIKEFRKHTRLPLIAEPNAGMPALKDGKTVFPMTADKFAEFVPQLINAGANIIGGCCGTNPEYITKIAKYTKGR